MMPWFPKQFAASTMGWSFDERSLYRCLLDAQWLLGALPEQPWRLAQIAGLPLDRFEEAWRIVATKFQSVPGGLQNVRLEEHRHHSQQLRRAKALAGGLGGRISAARRKQKASTASALPPSDAQHAVSAAHVLPTAERSYKSISTSTSTLSFTDADSREPHGATAWRDVEGLNVEAFEAYLQHLDALVAQGVIRANLAPHSRIAQAKWLAGQGNQSRQLDLVTRAIRNGWKTIDRDTGDKQGRAARTSFDDLRARAERS